METKGQIIIIGSLLFMLFGGFILAVFLIYFKRKNTIIEENERLKHQFETEIAESQLEIREQTLRNISWELHDNIGQLMTLAKIQAQNAKDNPKKIEEAANIIGSALQELRALSKSINPESLKSRNLVDALQHETDRLNRLNFLKAEINLTGIPYELNKKDEIILFRILQEFFSNTIRHAKATELKIEIAFHPNQIAIEASDNGIGFDKMLSEGIGLNNMQKRAEIIDAQLIINSDKNLGTEIQLIYPTQSL